LKFRENKALGRIEAGMLAAKKARPRASLWDLISEQIALIDPVSRTELRLFPECTFFWRFVRDEIEGAGLTGARLDMLQSLKRPCDFYGNFIEPGTRPVLRDEYGIAVKGMLDFHDLPRLYRDCGILVDMIHPCYISGSSPKITSCFAAGGLALFDWKDDFHEALGDASEMVMYRDFDHLNAMIDDYLCSPARRFEVAREMQQRVLEKFTFAHLAKRILVDQPAWR